MFIYIYIFIFQVWLLFHKLPHERFIDHEFQTSDREKQGKHKLGFKYLISAAMSQEINTDFKNPYLKYLLLIRFCFLFDFCCFINNVNIIQIILIIHIINYQTWQNNCVCIDWLLGDIKVATVVYLC